MIKIHIPRRKRGRQTSEAEDQYFYELREFAEAILKIDSRFDLRK